MVLKRYSREGGEEGSEFSDRDSKRQNAFTSDMSESSMQDHEEYLERFLRECVRQEVERAFNSCLRSQPSQTDSSEGSRILQLHSFEGSRIFQLHFDDKLPSTLFTGRRVEKEDSTLVKVVLRDSRSKKVITSGPLSSIKVTIIVLDGDFNKDDREDWTNQEFNRRILQERQGRRPLVTGTSVISLREGIGYIEDVSFTDNSRWTWSGKFRLGATTCERSIREGISNAFKVMDQRSELNKKHYPPSSVDEVWRLIKIAKDGKAHERLASHGICDVKDLLRLYVTDPLLLRNILGGKFSNKAWTAIIEHANTCVLDGNELYLYKAADGNVLVLNSIYKVVGAYFDGEHYLPLNMLNMSQKLLVENLKGIVYKNLSCLVPIGDQSLVAGPLLVSSLQTNPHGSPGIQNFNFPVEQEQMEMQVIPDHMKIAPADNQGVQDGNQLKVSGAETSHQMEAFNSNLGNAFVITDSYDELRTGGYNWDSPGSLGPLGFE